MKKNMLLTLLLATVCVPWCPVSVCIPLCQEQKEAPVAQEHEMEDFDDFFGEPDPTAMTPRKKKKKWSKLKIFMIKLGVAVALQTQSFYQLLSSVWAYLTSWVRSEQTSEQA